MDPGMLVTDCNRGTGTRLQRCTPDTSKSSRSSRRGHSIPAFRGRMLSGSKRRDGPGELRPTRTGSARRLGRPAYSSSIWVDLRPMVLLIACSTTTETVASQATSGATKEQPWVANSRPSLTIPKC